MAIINYYKRKDIKRLKNEAKQKGASHLLIVCDKFSSEQYPVFVMPSDNLKEIIIKFNDSKNMQSIDAIIHLQ